MDIRKLKRLSMYEVTSFKDGRFVKESKRIAYIENDSINIMGLPIILETDPRIEGNLGEPFSMLLGVFVRFYRVINKSFLNEYSILNLDKDSVDETIKLIVDTLSDSEELNPEFEMVFKTTLYHLVPSECKLYEIDEILDDEGYNNFLKSLLSSGPDFVIVEDDNVSDKDIKELKKVLDRSELSKIRRVKTPNHTISQTICDEI